MTNFLSTDPQAVLWFVVSGAIAGDRVVADYLTPSGSVYDLATANWDPLPSAGTYCFTSRSLFIAGTDAATQIGRWTARVRINGTMYASVPFNIQANTCTYSLSSTSQTMGTEGGDRSVGVTVVGSGCAAWTATSNFNWITVKSGASGFNSGTVTYSVAPNPNATSRTGTLTIAGLTFTVTQGGQCSYSLNSASQSLGSSGGSGTVSVTTTAGCAWTAVANVAWITVQSGASGSGSGSVTYSVAANTNSSSRTGTLTIAGRTFTVTQAGSGPQLMLSMMTRAKPPSCNLNNPPERETSFLSTDVQAFLWFYVANVQVADVVATEYYAPSGQLYAPASFSWAPTTVAADFCFSQPVSIAGAQAATMPGTWTVKVKFNGQPLFALTFSITAPATRPAIRSGGVTSAGGFGGMATITGGTWIEIMGSNLSTTTRTWTGSDFNGQNAPTSLDGVSVTVNSRPAFLSYISPTQVNALVPSDIGTGTMQIVVTNGNVASDAYTITANAVQPGLLAPSAFLVNGRQYVVAILPDSQFALPVGLIPGAASRPARPGETLVIYGIGFGGVRPSIPAGTIVSSANSLTGSLEMNIGSAPASIQFAGLAQSFVGLYQINVVVPNVPDGDAVPLTFTLNGVPGSTTLYLAVRHGGN